MLNKDIHSPWLLHVKAALFVVCAVLAATLLMLSLPEARTLLLLGVVAWSSARAYYFLFYVLEHYVDPKARYAGLAALLRAPRR